MCFLAGYESHEVGQVRCGHYGAIGFVTIGGVSCMSVTIKLIPFSCVVCTPVILCSPVALFAHSNDIDPNRMGACLFHTV